MSWLRAVVEDAGAIAWGNRWWMTWNSMLAVIPAMLAVAVFRMPARGWGVVRLLLLVLFVLFLPNAPYVVTDLVHLRGDVVQASSDAAVFAGILPLYVVFIGLGFASYALSLHELGAYLRRAGRSSWVRPAELMVHGLCAVGVLLGRVARLNSWDTFASPEATVARALETLSWSGSPVTLMVLFVVIWVGHATTRALAASAMAAAASSRFYVPAGSVG